MTEQKAQPIDQEAIYSAIGSVLSNASNFPDKVIPHILGRDLGPLIAKTTNTVIKALQQSDTKPKWRLKCPSCGNLMSEGEAYKTMQPPRYTEYVDGDPVSPLNWFDDARISGHKYTCSQCPCTVDIPIER